MHIEHIAKTVLALENRIAEYHRMIEFLTQFDSAQSGAAPAPLPLTPGLSQGKQRAASRKTVSTVSRPTNGSAIPRVSDPSVGGTPASAGRTKPNPAAIIKIAFKLKEPFGPTDLARAAGIMKSSAGSSITRWLSRGWIAKSGYGEYNRTPAFGNSDQTSPTSPTSQTSPTPAPAKSRADLERKLADACKQRDHAREQGRETMVEIFQKDIDRLEAQLAS